MITRKIIAVSIVALTCTAANPSFANESHQYDPGTIRLSTDEFKYINPPANNMQELLFYKYEVRREACQHYVAPPQGFYYDGCDIVRNVQVAQAPVTTTQRVETQRTEQAAPALLPSVANYQIYFDFDKAILRQSEYATLARVASEIKNYNPVEVTVTGHADTSGSAEYNQKLSLERATSVVQALERQGISSRVLDEKARGESDPAINTGDGVREPLNRRVTIDFRR